MFVFIVWFLMTCFYVWLPPGHNHGSEGTEIVGTQSHRLLHHGSRRWRETADGPSGSIETHVRCGSAIFVVLTSQFSNIFVLKYISNETNKIKVGHSGRLHHHSPAASSQDETLRRSWRYVRSRGQRVGKNCTSTYTTSFQGIFQSPSLAYYLVFLFFILFYFF